MWRGGGGGVRGIGACMVGGMRGRGEHVWQGVCMLGGVCGRGTCIVGGGVCMAGGHAWQGVCGEGACMVGGCAWHGGMHGWGGVRGRRDGHCSRRYASYWNAFSLCKVIELSGAAPNMYQLFILSHSL